MITKIKLTLVMLVVALSQEMSAQQSALFNTYSYDLMQLNIASIGRTCVEANMNYRAQWVGIKETPRLYQLNAAMALGKSNGIGLRVAQQSMSLLKVTNATLGYAYRIKVNQTSKVHLGLGVAWQQNSFAANKAIVMDNNDVSLTSNLSQQRSNNFDAEAGALFLGDKLTAGVSAFHIYNANNKFDLVSYVAKPQLNMVLAYKFNKGKSVEVEPWLVNRYTIDGSNQPEGMLNVKIKQLFTIGGGYRYNYGYLGLMGVEVGMFKIAYSYDYSSGKNTANMGSSHQLLLSIDLCKNKKVAIAETAVINEEPLYFVADNDKEIGPYKMEQLKEMVKSGTIKRATLIKPKGGALSVAAENVPELEPLFPPKEPSYYITIASKEQGPFSMSQLQEMVKSDFIKRNTPVRNSNETELVDAEKNSQLEPLFPPKETMYYTTIDGKEQGTFTMKQLQDMAANGKLKRQSPVRKSTENLSVEAEKVNEILPFFPNAKEVAVVKNINYLASGLLFGNGKTVLAPDKKSILDEIAVEFKNHPELKVYIEGFASKTGNPEINKVLSQKRAEHVRQELIKRGVNPAQILGNKAYGSDKVDSNVSDELNRAVHFQIIE